jgi:hypothetical protein
MNEEDKAAAIVAKNIADTIDAEIVEEVLAEEALKEGIAKLREKFSVKSALVAMINDYAFKAVEYKGKLENARTAVKRDFYAKKLLANNEEAADAIITLEKILVEEKQSDEPFIEEPEVPNDTSETS